jgi:hypothetical protein
MVIEDIFEAVLTFDKTAAAEGVKAELEVGTDRNLKSGSVKG